jgi:hypothetical protein
LKNLLFNGADNDNDTNSAPTKGLGIIRQYISRRSSKNMTGKSANETEAVETEDNASQELRVDDCAETKLYVRQGRRSSAISRSSSKNMIGESGNETEAVEAVDTVTQELHVDDFSEAKLYARQERCSSAPRLYARHGRRSSDLPVSPTSAGKDSALDPALVKRIRRSRSRRQSIEIASAFDDAQRIARRFEVVGSNFMSNSHMDLGEPCCLKGGDVDDDGRKPYPESDSDNEEPEPSKPVNASQRLSRTMRQALNSRDSDERVM